MSNFLNILQYLQSKTQILKDSNIQIFEKNIFDQLFVIELRQYYWQTQLQTYNNFIQDIMYNRHVYERDEKQYQFEQSLQKKLALLRDHHRRKKNNQIESNTNLSKKYKQRVNDFLVQITDSPPKLDTYQPPIKHIIRNPTKGKMICDPQLYINGFKTNRQRIQKAVFQQEILDLSPTSKDNSAMVFRPRNPQRQIQPGMKFASKNSKSVVVLPRITPPKMHFKALEQLGNNLKSMHQEQIQMVSLVNRLQTIAGPTKVNPMQMSMTMLQNIKILSKKRLFSE